MFHTDREPAELQALTTYSEKHGEERESGLALKLSVTMSNTVLDLFDPQLRPAFYRANDGISAQTDQPQADTPTPVLKMPPLTGHRWSKQITGAVVEISGAKRGCSSGCSNESARRGRRSRRPTRGRAPSASTSAR